MCPFRITWCGCPWGPTKVCGGTGKATDHRGVAMIETSRHRNYRYGTLSYRNLFPRSCCDPRHIWLAAAGALFLWTERAVARALRVLATMIMGQNGRYLPRTTHDHGKQPRGRLLGEDVGLAEEAG